MTVLGINSTKPLSILSKTKKIIKGTTQLANTTKPQMKELPNVSFGRDLISKSIELKANEP